MVQNVQWSLIGSTRMDSTVGSSPTSAVSLCIWTIGHRDSNWTLNYNSPGSQGVLLLVALPPRLQIGTWRASRTGVCRERVNV